MSDPAQQEREAISDRLVFKAVDAFNLEQKAWRVTVWGNGRALADDMKRCALMPVHYDADIPESFSFERHDFSSEASAYEYIRFRCVKEAIIAANQLKWLTHQESKT